MSKFKVTQADVIKLAKEVCSEEPVTIFVGAKRIIAAWDTDDKEDDASKLFEAGLGKYWDFDNDSDTQEFHCSTASGATTLRIERRI